MRLYYHPGSSNSRRVLLTAILLDVKIDLAVVDLVNGECRLPANQPEGKVPLLDDGDFRLWESHAIIQYLADKRGDSSLYPGSVQARADVNRWLFVNRHRGQVAAGIESNAIKAIEKDRSQWGHGRRRS
jgi:glutathione S-transferase